ncbi:MAG: aminotransferase class V-fold PLP-dependent enzyme, partial [Methylococcales bacterium]|nr:aminotransferase class V-fold PLP-dependent enzyme [Methylococcales bacterium]
MPNLRQHFLLDPDITFLNHGSFGATPKPVFEAYQYWQRQMELDPVHFIATELTEHFAKARRAMGALVKAPADDLVFVPNATFAVNTVARSIELAAGDEVLMTNHAYGACDKAWQFVCAKQGAKIVRADVTLPVVSAETIITTPNSISAIIVTKKLIFRFTC